MNNPNSNINSKNLVVSLITEHTTIADNQQYWIENRIYPDLTDERLYSKTLSNLIISGELQLRNAQLKELYFYKIKMMRSELHSLSLQLEKFKDTLKTFSNNHKKK